MRKGTFAVAVVVLFGSSAVHAAGLLQARLQPVVASVSSLAAPALAGKAAPALLPALAGLPGPGSSLPSEAPLLPGLPELPGLGDTYWLDYNLTIWPGQLTAWSNNAAAVSLVEASAIVAAAGGGDIIGAGNRAAGLLAKVGPAPAPQLPYGVPGVADTLWLDYNLRIWQGDVLNWTSDGAQTSLSELNVIVASGLSGDLAGAGDRAAGLLAKVGPAPAPQFPTAIAPYAEPTFALVNEAVFGTGFD